MPSFYIYFKEPPGRNDYVEFRYLSQHLDEIDAVSRKHKLPELGKLVQWGDEEGENRASNQSVDNANGDFLAVLEARQVIDTLITRITSMTDRQFCSEFRDGRAIAIRGLVELGCFLWSTNEHSDWEFQFQWSL